jgi:DNA-binding CsgD family transcriptional regulator
MLQNIVGNMDELEARIHAIAPMGYTLAVNVRLYTPEFYLTTFPEDWVRQYNGARLAFHDPVLTWCRLHNGTMRWSEIPVPYDARIDRHLLDRAEHYGLKFGGVVSRANQWGEGAKSLLSAAREDRELSDMELQELADILDEIAVAVGRHAGLTEEELAALRDLATGMTHIEIADLRAVSPSTVKKRIERARIKLGARNALHAVALATKRGLIPTDQAL